MEFEKRITFDGHLISPPLIPPQERVPEPPVGSNPEFPKELIVGRIQASENHYERVRVMVRVQERVSVRPYARTYQYRETVTRNWIRSGAVQVHTKII